MMDKILINNSLISYLQKLFYEKERYNDLLTIIEKDFTDMTDEEWKSSLEYYQILRQEANIKFQAAWEFLEEEYKTEINNRPFFINFANSYIGFDFSKMNQSEGRVSFSDLMAAIYAEENKPMRGALDVTFQITDECNMNCSYCYQHNKGQHYMNFETAKILIDSLLNENELTNEYCKPLDYYGLIFNFIGGEPMLNIDLADKIIKYSIGEMFRMKHPFLIRVGYSLDSNGLLHFSEKIQNFLKTHKTHLSYSVSLDGNKVLHDKCRVDKNGNGTYDRVFAAIKDYKENFGGFVGNKMTLSPDNIYYLYDSIVSMIDLGYSHIFVNCAYESGWNNDHAIVLYQQLKQVSDYLIKQNLQDYITISMLTDKIGEPLEETYLMNWCGGTGHMLAIDYKGDLYPCLRYMESSLNGVEPYIIGNITDGINHLDIHKKRIECLRCIDRKTQSSDECFNCPIAEGCGWCSAYNYECFKTPNKRATYICQMHKARVLASYYYKKLQNIDYKMNCPKEWSLEIISEDEYNFLIN